MNLDYQIYNNFQIQSYILEGTYIEKYAYILEKEKIQLINHETYVLDFCIFRMFNLYINKRANVSFKKNTCWELSKAGLVIEHSYKI